MNPPIIQQRVFSVEECNKIINCKSTISYKGDNVPVNLIDDIEENKFSNNVDTKFKKEVETDYVNNNLMDRMNSEMELRNKNNKHYRQDTFVSPYDNGGTKELFDVYYNERINKDFRNKGSKSQR